MAFEKGKPNPGKGRPKGTPNKITVAAKEAIQAAFDKLGGTDAFVKWAEKEKNQTAFYAHVYPKLLPLDMKIAGELTSKIVQVELPKKR